MTGNNTAKGSAARDSAADSSSAADSFAVTARRDGKFWFVDVPAVARATQAKRPVAVEKTARDLIAIMTNRDPADITVDIAWQLEGDVEIQLQRVSELRETARKANADSAAEARLAARSLHQTGLGPADIGAVLGVSRQRAHQLIRG